MQSYFVFCVKKFGLRGILRGSLFILVIILTLNVFPWAMRNQFKLLERSCNTQLWYKEHPNITAYLSFNNETNCKYCRNATKICQSNREDERGKQVAYFILSYIKNQSQRNAIRRTWASATNLRPVFVMGIHSNESKMISASREAEEYEDMIIENFADTFENATLKTASILKHFKMFCGNVTYLLKTEDDVFVNTDVVENTLRQHTNATQEGLKIIGYIHYGARVVRNIRSVWYVEHSLQRTSKYPTYASRRGYILPGNKIEEILDKSIKIPILPIEDVYFTGLVASALGLHHLMDESFNAEAITVKNYCTIKSQSLIHAPDSPDMEKLWSALQLNNPSVCFTFWNRLMIQLFT